MTRTALIAALVALAAPASALALEQAPRQTAKFTFTDQRPGMATGLQLEIDYVNPDDPGAKPPAVRKVVEGLAPGARFDTSAPELCLASDPELMLLGTAACPAGSKVGAGILTLDTGLPQPSSTTQESSSSSTGCWRPRRPGS